MRRSTCGRWAASPRSCSAHARSSQARARCTASPPEIGRDDPRLPETAGKDSLHQLKLIIERLGAPSAAELALIENEQAVRYVASLRPRATEPATAATYGSPVLPSWPPSRSWKKEKKVHRLPLVGPSSRWQTRSSST